MSKWSVERLDRSHERGKFACGKTLLDQFLRSLVGQYEKRRLGRTHVAVRPGEKQVHGYYTLVSSAVPFQHLPATVAKKLPRHPVPVILLARLAVDQAMQRGGLGTPLLMDALKRCLGLSDQLGIHAVEVHAIDAQAKAFYEKFGFVSLQDSGFHLYLPMTAVEDVCQQGDEAS